MLNRRWIQPDAKRVHFDSNSFAAGRKCPFSQSKYALHAETRWDRNLPWPVQKQAQTDKRSTRKRSRRRWLSDYYGKRNETRAANSRDGKRTTEWERLPLGPVLLYTVEIPHSYFASRYIAHERRKIIVRLMSKFWKQLTVSNLLNFTTRQFFRL